MSSRDRIDDRDSTVILVEDVESLSSPSRVSPSKIRARIVRIALLNPTTLARYARAVCK